MEKKSRRRPSSIGHVHETNVKAICIYSLKSIGFLRVFGTNVFSNYTKIKYEFSLHTVYTFVRSETNEYVWSLFFRKICRQKICRNDNIYIYLLCLFCELKDHKLITICLREIKIYGIPLWKFITYILERLLYTYLYLFIQ